MVQKVGIFICDRQHELRGSRNVSKFIFILLTTFFGIIVLKIYTKQHSHEPVDTSIYILMRSRDNISESDKIFAHYVN